MSYVTQTWWYKNLGLDIFIALPQFVVNLPLSEKHWLIFSYYVFPEAIMTITDFIIEYKVEPFVHMHKLMYCFLRNNGTMSLETQLSVWNNLDNVKIIFYNNNDKNGNNNLVQKLKWSSRKQRDGVESVFTVIGWCFSMTRVPNGEWLHKV